MTGKNPELVLITKMTHKKEGLLCIPFFVNSIEDKYIVAAYQGKLSENDILVKYRQKENNKWTRPRTPKHIHWAVDLLIKQFAAPEISKVFLDFLIEQWDSTPSITSLEERKKYVN